MRAAFFLNQQNNFIYINFQKEHKSDKSIIYAKEKNINLIVNMFGGSSKGCNVQTENTDVHSSQSNLTATKGKLD